MKTPPADPMHNAPLSLPAALSGPNFEQEPESPAIQELSISGYWMLVVLGVGVIAMEPILWVVIRRWLFAP